MILHKCKRLVAFILVLLLAANPILGTVAYAAGEAPDQGFFQKTAGYFGSLFGGGGLSAAAETGDELGDMVDQGLFDPLLQTLGGYFSGLLEDERFKEIIDEVLTEISEDESLLNLDSEAFIVMLLRDARLTEILGEVIADSLKSDEALSFIERLAGDVEKLLKDEQFASFLNKAILDLLQNEQTNAFILDLIQMINRYADQVLSSITDEEAQQTVVGFLTEVKDLLMAPYLTVFDDLLEDPRVAQSIERILAMVEGLPDEYAKRLLGDPADPVTYPGDPEFKYALDSLKKLFLRPLAGDPEDVENYPGILNHFLKNVQESALIKAALARLSDELFSDAALAEVYALLDEMMGDMSAVTSPILAEVMGGVDGYADGLGLGAKTYKDDYRILVAVEWEVGPYLTHLFDCISFVLGQNSEEMSLIMAKYFGEDAPYLGEITSALSEKATAEWPDVWVCRDCGSVFDPIAEGKAFGDLPPGWVCPVCGAAQDRFVPPPGTLKFALLSLLDEYMGAADLGAVIENLMAANEGLFDEILSDALHDFKADLLFLLAGQGDRVMDVLFDMLEALYPYVEGDEEGDLAGMLEQIALEIPALSPGDLIDGGAVGGWVDNLLGLTSALPLQSYSPYLRANADEIGYNVAYNLLHGLAEGIENPVVDERKEAIMAMLKNEERMRRFYLDLGGSDPDKITAETGDLGIILAVLMEVLQKEERVQGLLEDIDRRSQPLRESLTDYLQMVGDVTMTGLRDLFGPFLYRAMDLVTIFPLKSEQAERHLAAYIAPENLTEEIRRTWALIAGALADTAGFANESLAGFIRDHRAISDFATVERFSVINLFYAEMADAEALKQKGAEEKAAGILDRVRSQLGHMLPGLAGSFNPQGLSGSVNSVLASLFPAGTYRFSSESMGLSVEDVREMLVLPLDGMADTAWSELGELLNPLANLPADVLEDGRTGEALGEITGFVPGAAGAMAAKILNDDRIPAFVMAVADAALDEYLSAAEGMVNDPRFEAALSDAAVRVLSAPDFRGAVADLAGDLLSDADLIDLLEHALHQGRIISIGWPWQGINPFFLIGVNDGGNGKGAFATNRDKRNHEFALYKPEADWNPAVQASNPVYMWVRGPQVGGTDKIPVASDYDANWRPDNWVYPDPLFKEPSTSKWGGPDLRVHMKGWINDPDENSNPLYYNQYDEHPFLPEGHKFPVCLNQNFSPQSSVNVGLMIPHYYMEMAANNAIFAFTENFMKWLDPSRSYAIKAPADEFRDVLNVFLGEASVRKRVAEPLAGALGRTAVELVGDGTVLKSAILGHLQDMFEHNNPLAAMAAYVRSDEKLPALLGSALSDLPVSAAAALLRDNEDITGLMEDNLSTVPRVLELLISTLRQSAHLGTFIGDAAVDIPLDTIRPLLRLQPETLATVAARVNAFPLEGVARFLQREGRAYRLGYIVSDLQPRFMKELLSRPELIELEAGLVNEKLNEANYTLADSLVGVVDRVMGNAQLDEYLGDKLYSFVIKVYDNLRDVFRPLGRFFGFENAAGRGGVPLETADH